MLGNKEEALRPEKNRKKKERKDSVKVFQAVKQSVTTRQAAEHYGRIVNSEQGKIDSSRDTKEKAAAEAAVAAEESTENSEDEDAGFPDFITNLK